MTGPDFAFLVELAREHAGLELRADGAFHAEMRLGALARREGEASVDTLVARLRAGGDPALAAAAVEALANGETSFFRDRQVFERLQAEVLPSLAQRRPGRPLRVWSVGCGTGQEVYSLALAAAAAGRDAPVVELFASDLSERALQKARAGLFSHFEVQRGLPIRLLLAHFEKVDDLWRASPRLRQGVRWAQFNLMDDLSRIGPFDMVLCRNVLSGFTQEAAASALERLERVVAPDGCLVLAPGEGPPSGAFAGEGGVFLRDPAIRRAAA